jgi:Flp pilus assembly protein TadD
MPAGASKEAGFGQSYYRYGKYYFEQGEYRQAITYFNKSIAAKPDDLQAYMLLGISYRMEGNDTEALDIFARAVNTDPDSPAANYYLALSLLDAGDWGNAIKHLEKAAQLAPDNPETWDKLGSIYVRVGNFRGALFAYEQLIELVPDNAAVHQRYAEALMQTGFANEAVTEATLALKLNPKQTGANLLLGRYYWGIGDVYLAEEHLLREVAISPELLPAYFFTADFYVDIGRPDEAAKYYKKYRENGGQPDEKLEILLQ